MNGNELLYRAPVAQAPSARGLGLLLVYRRVALVAVYVAIAFASVESRLGQLSALGVVGALLFWVSLDARIQEKSFPHGAAVPFAVSWPIAIAVWLVWTRRLAGLGLYLLGVLVALVVAGAAHFLVQVLR
jgi:hypothetical protein